jgi:hypothetical protein
MTAGLSRSRPLATASTRYGCGARSSRPTLPRVKSAPLTRPTGSRTARSSKACGNRRGSVCASCSATYQADSFQLLAAGVRGGKGVPERVARHPSLFVTFTAPSFGPVHSRRAQGLLVYPCHPYRQGQRCLHGRRAGCWQRHDEDDPHLGEPLCPRCYQAGAQVLWNALAGRLWSRTTIYVYRALAQLAGVTEGELRTLVRVSFAKVAEYQKRARSTSTPLSAWTRPPPAPARPVSLRRRPGSPPTSSRPPSGKLPRPSA